MDHVGLSYAQNYLPVGNVTFSYTDGVKSADSLIRDLRTRANELVDQKRAAEGQVKELSALVAQLSSMNTTLTESNTDLRGCLEDMTYAYEITQDRLEQAQQDLKMARDVIASFKPQAADEGKRDEPEPVAEESPELLFVCNPRLYSLGGDVNRVHDVVRSIYGF